MANMVLRAICALVTVWVASVSGKVLPGPPPNQNTYYTIVDADGSNLGVDPAVYRRSLDELQEPVSTAVVTLPTNGDYEKWSIVRHKAGMYYIINKATGLYLTVGPIRWWYFETESAYSVRTQLPKDHGLQCFSFKPKPSYPGYYGISHGEEFFVTSLKTPTFDVPQTPLYSRQMEYIEKKRAVWQFQPVDCDPHPHQMYQIIHYQSGRHLSMDPLQTVIFTVDDQKQSSAKTGFVFVPTKFDRKVFYIQNSNSGKVISIGGLRKYGSLLEQDVKDETEQNLSQHWYILTSPGGRLCIFGNVATYRYFGPNNHTHVIQKEHTVTLDEYWYLKGSN